MERYIKPTYDELESYVENLQKQLADAQATIAALQARVKELEAIKTPDDAFTYCAYCGEKSPVDEHNEDLAAHIKVCPKHPMRDVESQLAQRTAKLEAAKAIQAIDLKNNNAYREQVATLQAELERVRADNKALDEWRADVTVSLQRPGGAFFVDVPQHIKDLVKERDDLRTLLLALPKVEGAVVVSNGYVKDSTRCHALFGADEDAASYAALLKHRQGMEG